MYREVGDLGYLPAPQAGVDYVESTPRSCLYVPCERFRNLGTDGKYRSGPGQPMALYRLIGTQGLLYIGIGIQPEKRWYAHARWQSWWSEVLVKTVDWYMGRDEALVAEYLAIKHERPRYNSLNQYPRPWKFEYLDARNEINARFQ